MPSTPDACANGAVPPSVPSVAPYPHVGAGSTGAAGVVCGMGIISGAVAVPMCSDGSTRLSIAAGAMSGA